MSELEQRIESGDWTIGVIGLGYVGLPLAVAATKAGIGAIGYDIDVEYVDRLRRGFSSIEDVTDEDLQAASTAGFRLTHDAADLSG